VTGREEEIAKLTRTLGVFHAIREPEESGEYLVDHASKLWLVDPEARYVALLDDPHEPRPFLELLARIRALGGES
jgi:cytochrome oxidase Cu insertion factor (SCO1/SenC/PrrC family)